jgi:hypothetical protein
MRNNKILYLIFGEYLNLVLKTAAGLFLLTLILYSSTVPNTNPDYADSDELITAAYVFGIPHPPGYPLYTFSSALFGRLPIPYFDFAGKINLLSAVLHSGTVVIFFIATYLLLQRFTTKQSNRKNLVLNIFISLAGAFSLAFAFHFWFHGIVAEVFSLNSFLASLTMLFLVIWSDLPEKASKKHLLLLLAASFIFGLAASNQQASLVLLPVFLYWVLANIKYPRNLFTSLLRYPEKALDKYRIFISTSIISVLVFLTGIIIPYIYVPIAAGNKPFLNWENAVSLNGVYRLITRRAYAEVSPQNSAYISFNQLNLENSFSQFWYFLIYLRENYTSAIFIIGLIGLFYLVKTKERKLLGLVLLGIICGGLFFAIYAPIDWSRFGEDSFISEVMIHQRFYLMSLFFYSILIAFGALGLWNFFLIKGDKVRLIAMVVVCLLILLEGFGHFNAIQKNNFKIGHQYYETLFKSLEKDSILICFTPEKGCFAGYYLQNVEKLRPDVVIVPADYSQRSVEQLKEQLPGIINTTSTNQSARTRDIIRWQIGKRPIYFTGLSPDPNWLSIFNIDGNPYFLVPKGCGLFQVAREFNNPSYVNPCQGVEQLASQMAESTKNKYKAMINPYFAYHHYFAGLIYQKNACVNSSVNEYQKAVELFPDYEDAKQKLASLSKLVVPKNDCIAQTGFQNISTLMEESEKSKENGDLENAIYLSHQATMLEPENIALRIRLAELYKAANYLDLAKTEYQDILVLDPDNSQAKEQLNR